jgi:hypothetical protein
MKRICAGIFALAIFSTSHSQSLSWGNEITVASASTYGSMRPRIVLDGSNEPLILWGQGAGSESLWTARWNGTGFAAPVSPMPAGWYAIEDVWMGADMASKGDTVYVVFKRDGTPHSYVARSADGGQTWATPVQFDLTTYSTLASVEVTADGNPVIMYMEMYSDYYVINSTDGGMTFSLPVTVNAVAGNDVCDCCPGYLAVDGNRQVAAWRTNNNNMRDIWFAVSNDGGATFPSGADIDPTNWVLTSCPSVGPDPLLNGDTLITVFMSSNRIYVSTANVNTGQVGVFGMIAGSIPGTSIQTYPFIAGSGDTLIAVWQQNTSGNTDVWYSFSTTGASGLFTNAAMINSTTTGLQTAPHVAYKNGVFHFTWRNISGGVLAYRTATIVPAGMEEEGSSMLLVYPNPSSGNMTIDLSAFANENVTIELLDLTGSIIQSENSSGKDQFELQHHAAGVYVVRITGGEKTMVKRIIFN